jgi:transcriptional regulator with XRE-family HTH domain
LRWQTEDSVVIEQEAFGGVIRSFRLALEMSQEALAEAAGLHRTYIGGIERGERNVSLRNIYALARALGTSAGELLAQTDKLIEEGTTT